MDSDDARTHILESVETDVEESLSDTEPFLNPENIPDDTTLVDFHSDSDDTVKVISRSDSDEYDILENSDLVKRTNKIEEVVDELNTLL